ncbi:2-methylaconitate cis-trans isomerase PrpF [Psychrobacter cryohalolentis]|uniref:2-methylaconitate cis-trans isomerase n=2 Tax=Psychrobacter cryohalolentis TaxID=330922 RepID=Q1QB66_PSYCK|nr:2-methylaconitate cis-trans isomerase PrpF [Psychrobacter cryohalolentis]ABE75087.1 2-methylaconitate cis-trans isomerase [Psychrobacter cryohalolentis K5]ASE25290.1 2-methylaconitate cis-trans isomerase PrpF [Psychrobacter cryohalolentis]
MAQTNSKSKPSFAPQLSVPATYMRGGTSKGTFFKLSDLPERCQVAGESRDQFLLRVIGSPDPYGKQIDGLGNGSSSTSKTVILSESDKADHDVNYLFGQVNIAKPMIDWAGNCGNLTASVGACAINMGLIDADKIANSANTGICEVHIWQENISKTIIAHVPVYQDEQGKVQVQETGDFELDGVTFPAAEVKIEFIDPVDSSSDMFPTNNLIDDFDVSGCGLNIDSVKATFISAGIPTIFMKAEDLGFTGTELQGDINSDGELLAKLEKIRATGGVAMGLFKDVSEAQTSQHIPKIAWVAPAQSYSASSGKAVDANDIDLVVRAMSMGQLHHAMMGTAAVAIAAAATTQGTLVNEAAGGSELGEVRFGHPSGTLLVGGKTELIDGRWQAKKVSMSRSARRIMIGEVFVPADAF